MDNIKYYIIYILIYPNMYYLIYYYCNNYKKLKAYYG